MVATLDATFAALASTTRREILLRLRDADASVAELAEPFSMTVRAISKHVAVLEAAGLISKRRNGQRIVSSLRVEPIREVDTWLAAYRHVWDTRFDSLEDQLRSGR